ncbi:MAG: dodecin domain-containing protein [Bacteroidetes bacterium]|nr:dodecin domain-containing protein [Bacteroidota bacterium]
MGVIKVIEVLANSKVSWEEATQNAVAHAYKTVQKIKSVNVSKLSATVDSKGKISEYRINVKISFELE